MIKIGVSAKIEEISKKEKDKSKKKEKTKSVSTMYNTIRPEVVDAKVYKLKSAFVKNSVFITLSYVNDNSEVRPIEIFINSKDLTRAPEYVVLTRLVSAIFRRSNDPMFILEELQGIFDPNGGTFKDGKYYHSFYAEIADVIERFFSMWVLWNDQRQCHWKIMVLSKKWYWLRMKEMPGILNSGFVWNAIIVH